MEANANDAQSSASPFQLVDSPDDPVVHPTDEEPEEDPVMEPQQDLDTPATEQKSEEETKQDATAVTAETAETNTLDGSSDANDVRDEKTVEENKEGQAEKQMDEHNNDNGDSNSNNNNNKLICSVVIIAIFIAFVRNQWQPGGDVQEFHCPSTPIYIPINIARYDLDAYSAENPRSTRYKWRYDTKQASAPQDLIIMESDNLLKLRSIKTTGSMDVRLSLKATDAQQHTHSSECPVRLIFHPVPYFGIDLGTTYSCIAYQSAAETDAFGKRKPNVVVADKVGNRYCLPTAVFFPLDKHASIEVGVAALEKRNIYPHNVVYDVKRIIGRTYTDAEVGLFKKSHPFQIDVNNNRPVVKIPRHVYDDAGVETIGRTYDTYFIEETLSPLLAYLVSLASSEFSVPYIADVVISVPAYFNDNQRKAVQNACKIAGLNPVQLVVEPTAAALAHAYYVGNIPEKNFDLFMVWDFGGGTFDCSILQCVGENCEVYAVHGDPALGGIDFDRVILDIMKKELMQQHKWKKESFTDEIEAMMLFKAEDVKIQLSKQVKSHPIYIKNDKIVITRKQFVDDPKTQKLLDKANKIAVEAINKDPDHDISSLRMILMVGGTSGLYKIPSFKTKVEKVFKNVPIVEPNGDSQLTVVQGSAVIGGYLAVGDVGIAPGASKKETGSDKKKKQNVIDVLPMSLGFEVCDGYGGTPGVTCNNMDIVVESSTRYPVQTKRVYQPFWEAAHAVTLQLYQGEHSKTDHNYKLKEVTITGFTQEIRECYVVLTIDVNGLVKVTAVVGEDGDEVFEMSHGLTVESDDFGLTHSDIGTAKKRLAKSNFLSAAVGYV